MLARFRFVVWCLLIVLVRRHYVFIVVSLFKFNALLLRFACYCLCLRVGLL